MFNPSTDKKIALFLADGCEEIEALTVADIAYRAGIPCTKVSVSGERTVTSSHNVTILADLTVEELDFNDFDMLVLPGGLPGTNNLAACGLLREALVRFAGEGRQIAAICAAPSVLASLGLLKGIRSTCNPSFENALREGGADFCEDTVAVSKGFITSRAMGTAVPFALAIVSHYLGEEAARKLGAGILFPGY